MAAQLMPLGRFAVAACLVVTRFTAAGFGATPAEPGARAVDRGHRLFDVHCAGCHGIGGGGGEGPSLLRPILRYAPDNPTLVRVIRNGIPRTGMGGTGALSSAEARDVAAYVRSLGRVVQAAVTGDAVRGRAIFDQQDCGACHITAGLGRGIGPELTSIGGTRGADYIRESLVDPAATVADEYRVVTVRGKDGSTVRGLRVNEHEFAILVRDANARLHTFLLKEIMLRKEMGESLMPSYAKRLSSEEIENLVTYLVGLRGAR
jgi:putative heme-binding domain-containing protein